MKILPFILGSGSGGGGSSSVGVEVNDSLIGTQARINFIEGSNITISAVNDGGNSEVDVTISASGSVGAPATAQYLTLATDLNLDAERVLAFGSEFDTTDGGANGNYDVALHLQGLTTDATLGVAADYLALVDTGEVGTPTQKVLVSDFITNADLLTATAAAAAYAALSHNHAASEITSGLLAMARGGLNKDVSADNGILKVSAGVTSIVTDNSSNWDLAHGWGDHGTQGYITDVTGDNIDALANVTITAVGTGEILAKSAGNWINQTLAEAGIAADSHNHSGTYHPLTTVGIADNNLVEIDALTNPPINTDYARFTANGLEGQSPAEVLADIGAAASGHNHAGVYLPNQTIGIADNNLLEVDGVTNLPLNGDYARFTANGLEGQSASEVLADIGAAASGHNHTGTYQPLDNDLTTFAAIAGVRGDVLYYGAGGWARLGYGTSGQFLTTQGIGADPTWTTASGTGDLLASNNLSDVNDAQVSLDNLLGADASQAIRPGTTAADAVLFQAYDNDTGPGYVTFATLTSGNAPSFDLETTVTMGGNPILTTADEGSGNGLDADTLDGVEGSGYATSGHNHSGVYEPADSDLTKIAGLAPSRGDTLIYGATGWENLAAGATSGHVLTSNGAAADPSWQAVAGSSVSSLSDTTITGPVSGDLLQYSGAAWVDRTLAEAGIQAQDALLDDIAAITGSTGGTFYFDGANIVQLAAGTNGHVLTLAAGVPTWAAGGSGDVNQTGTITAGDISLYTAANTIGDAADIATSVTFRLSAASELSLYDPTNAGNPAWNMGAAIGNRMQFQTLYIGATQELDYVHFYSETSSVTADKGLFRFSPDASAVLDIDDGGINFAASKGISIAGVDILTDVAGSSTLSNIDNIDATTQTTLEAALAFLAAADIGVSVQAQGAVLDDLNTTGAATGDNQVLVSTGAGVVAWESGATLLTSIGADPIGTDNSTDVTLAAGLDYLTIAAQEITLNKIDATTDFMVPSEATGDILYKAAGNWARLGVGTNGHVLTLAAGVPSWAAPTGGGATQLSELSDVNTSTATTGNMLIADGVDFESRALLEADISDLGTTILLDSDIGGSVLAQQTIGIADNNLVEIDGITNLPVNGDYARFTANGLEGRANSEVLSDIGAAASGHNHTGTYLPDQTIGIADNNLVEVDGVTNLPVNGDYARFTANGLEGRSNAEVLSDIGAQGADAALDTYIANLLTAGELTQLQNIGTTVISAADWIAVAALVGTNTGDEPAATDTTAGVIELATIAETNTGTAIDRAVTPDGLDGWTGSAQITTLGTIATGVWSGTIVTEAKGGTGAATFAAAGLCTLDDADQTITGGANVTVLNQGSKSAAYTLDYGARPLQRLTNASGTWELSPDTSEGTMVLLVLNDAAPGTIGTANWDKVTGDGFTATANAEFICYCTTTNDGTTDWSHIHILDFSV